jgi:NAD(P)-dependent dehydrogenase (short-subunit alcohol dehydrogenase family)
MSVTLKAPVFLTRAFAAALGGGEGAVVNVTDWRTARPYADHLTYHLAKAGLDAFTEAAAVQLAPTIRVNAVALGAILPPPGEGSEYLKQLAGGLPLQRTGNPGLVADAVLYLLRSDFTTGEILRIAGGAHLV